MTRHFWLIAAFSVCLLLQSDFIRAGGDKKQADPKKAPDFYPLQVGNQWEYDLTVNGQQLQMVAKIARMEKINDVELAVLEAKVGGQVTATEHLRQTDQGLLRYRTNQFVAEPPLMLLKYPVKEGDKWGGPFSVGETKAKYSCETKEEMVEVTAGKYKAMKVAIKLEENNKIVTTTYWFVQNVGFVKQTVEADNLNITIELQKVDLKKPAAK